MSNNAITDGDFSSVLLSNVAVTIIYNITSRHTGCDWHFLLQEIHPNENSPKWYYTGWLKK